jgi:hypothetical protein
MSNNIECATLCLATCGGNTNTFNTSCVWNNINLRTVLGPMYDKYDTFVIEINSLIASVSSAVLGTNENDLTLLLQMSGLPLVNNTFNCISNHNINAAIIGPIYFTQNETSLLTFQNSPKLTFGKNSDIVNITINLLRCDFTTPATAVAFPNIVYLFNIYGIPKEEGDLNNTRMPR